MKTSATILSPPRHGPVEATTAVGLKPPRAVVMWSALGALSLAVVLHGWLRWITSGTLEPTPGGPDQFGGGELVLLRGLEFLSAGSAMVLIWSSLLRPLLRTRRLSWDGMMLIGALTAWFYEPVLNYFNPAFLFNTHLVQLGSWVRWIPGWDNPNADRLVEPLLFNLGGYAWFLCGIPMLGCALLRKMTTRYPRASGLQLLGVLLGFFVVLDFVLEVPLIMAKVWVWPGVPHWLTLWSGRYYQFPLLESVFVGCMLTSLTCLRFFRDDRGRSVAERGVDDLRWSDGRKRAASFLAVVGLMHAIWFLTYIIPFNVLALKAGTYPALPSYLRQGICGDGTDYACPSEYVPIPHGRSVHVAPDDPRLPEHVRKQQGMRPADR
jgi:hypothetical protein